MLVLKVIQIWFCKHVFELFKLQMNKKIEIDKDTVIGL